MAKQISHNLPLVVICGRTNVGKSTLFNRLIEKQQALISNIPGTTRDSNISNIEWNNNSFSLIDTAGIIDWQHLTKKITDVDIDSQAQKQITGYLKKAELILFVVDNKAGLQAEDREIAKVLRRHPEFSKKTLLVVNKLDNFSFVSEIMQFNRLGLGEPLAVSASRGTGTGDLLDIIIERIPKVGLIPKEKIEKKEIINVCLLGKPNVGKSSLLNAIVGYKKLIVSPIAHTTREPQNIDLIYQEKKITLIDTAGISKQGKKSKGLEKPGILKSLKVLEKADIAILVLDISEPLTQQDAKIIQEIVDRQKSLIIVANKWDKVLERDTKKWTNFIYNKFPFVSWAPLQFLSAKTSEKVNKLLNLVLQVSEQRSFQLSDSQCNKFLSQVVKIHKPAKGKGLKAPHIYELKQEKNNPPVFTVRIGPNDNLHFSYLRFMENRLREKYGFIGTPIKMLITQNKKSHTTYNY